MSQSKSIYDILRNNFTIVNLGCLRDEDLRTPDSFKKVITLMEIDAFGESIAQAKYHRRVSIKQPISGLVGKRIFRRNSLAGTSSLLNPEPELVKAYALEKRYWKIVEKTEVECETLPNLIAANGINSFDFLKTDLEGLDFEIIKSCEQWLGKIQVIQAELRFEPLYETERPFHEVVSYLAGFGYEVLDIMHMDRWVYDTAHRFSQFEGRAMHADFLFVLKPSLLTAASPEKNAESIAKQILLLSMLGKKNYAEYLLERFQTALPAEWLPELEKAVARFAGFKFLADELRQFLHPFEFFLRHMIGRSEHSSVKP
jgi:FkbM family methyltransferase